MTTAAAHVQESASTSLFEQAFEEVAESLDGVMAAHPEWVKARVLDRLREPDRIIRFRKSQVQNRRRMLQRPANCLSGKIEQLDRFVV